MSQFFFFFFFFFFFWWIGFVVWLTDEKHLALSLFPVKTIVRNLTISSLQHTTCSIWTYKETGFRLYWMMLCSSDNHYTTAMKMYFVIILFHLISSKWKLQSTYLLLQQTYWSNIYLKKSQDAAVTRPKKLKIAWIASFISI